MTITKIIKGPHRLAGWWWVIADCNGSVQYISCRTEQKAREVEVGKDSAMFQ